LPAVSVRSFSENTVVSGGAIGRSDIADDCPVQEGWVQMKSEAGNLIALGEVSMVGQGVRIQPKKVFGG